MTAQVRIPAGVRFLRWLTATVPSLSVSNMDERTLRRMQSSAIPENPVVGLFLGRPRPDVRTNHWSFAGPGGQVPVRVYTPRAATSRPRPLVLNLHGGGFVLGSARQSDWIAHQVAAGVGAVVVAPDYRLAPTDPFPAAVEDAVATLEWAVENASEFGADGSRIAVMGDSAGGTLAAVLALHARDHGLGRDGTSRIVHQGLVYPATELTDERFEQPSSVANTRPILLSNRDMEVFRSHYVPPGTDLTDWRLSPYHAADHTGLPPATVVLAGLDPLHDTGARYAQKLADAGVEVRVEEYHRMPHGFLTFPYLCKDARHAAAALVRDQRAAFAVD
ncbi:MAG: alpha/beta hydrolase [Nocardioides sp.]|uniref:alpha/beta hydrolase n=1 Tax=Nocardioides sp. TaxID=35761 RepID=UPI003EFF4FD6